MEKKRNLAEESPRTRRAREKLRQKLAVSEQKITPQALERKAIEIHRWIARHAQDRIVLKDKEITLFNESQHTAALSRKVDGIGSQLRERAAGAEI